MSGRVCFNGKDELFSISNADRISGLYLPSASETGLKSCFGPDLSGDAKTDQNHFLLEPVSILMMKESRASRNFWLLKDGEKPWSVTGRSAAQMALAGSDQQEEMEYEAGYMFQRTCRTWKKGGLSATVTSFVPYNENTEIHTVKVCNVSRSNVTFAFASAIPIYGRSADTIRDHRHVTSLLHVTHVTPGGVVVTPTMSFDERGHQKGDASYFVLGLDETGHLPKYFFPVRDDYIGDNGSLENPGALRSMLSVGLQGLSEDARLPGASRIGDVICGQESMGAFTFAPVTLAPGACISYITLAGIDQGGGQMEHIQEEIRSLSDVADLLYKTRKYWSSRINVRVTTGDEQFDSYFRYIALQPELRRLYGCSFLPHHDYGRGGRGWRDLWQDCLALLLLDPSSVRDLLVSNCGGVRIDGTNATIIGSGPGEFKADRNSITRVWMDHAMWPLLTVKLYLDQSGDYEFLFEEAGYFCDAQTRRGRAHDPRYENSADNVLRSEDGTAIRGSVLEHLLIENLTAFWEVGEHQNLLLRDADWNDALDLGGDKGESVAFTHAYAANLEMLADLLETERMRTMRSGKINLPPQLRLLLPEDGQAQAGAAEKRKVLERYLDAVSDLGTEKEAYDAAALSAKLREMSHALRDHLRCDEWISDDQGGGWFNSYYDNDGNALDAAGPQAHMMLTGQVFAVMGGVADEEQVQAIIRSADRYLYDERCGGYRLNTDYQEVKFNMGRMFGFAYGEKENGAVFSHMAVMYGNALYQRNHPAEGYKALSALYRQASDFEVSRMLPGIPEYFGRGGRGLYSWLTGAGSWYLITVVTQMFGIRGEGGDLIIAPALMKEQFDRKGMASIALRFADRDWIIHIENQQLLEAGSYSVKEAVLDGMQTIPVENGRARIALDTCICNLDAHSTHEVMITLA